MAQLDGDFMSTSFDFWHSEHMGRSCFDHFVLAGGRSTKSWVEGLLLILVVERRELRLEASSVVAPN